MGSCSNCVGRSSGNEAEYELAFSFNSLPVFGGDAKVILSKTKNLFGNPARMFCSPGERSSDGFGGVIT